MKQRIIDHIKNAWGWRTSRKIVVLSVDDYGNVRLDGPEARRNMDAAGLPIFSRFDQLDTIETTADLEQLYQVLQTVTDARGKSAVMTPFTLPCNLDFEAIAEADYRIFAIENLPVTFDKLSARHPDHYRNTWAMWQEGIRKGLMAPQYHGREHVNRWVYEDKMQQRDPQWLCSLQNRSYTSIADEAYPNMSAMAAFDFDTPEQLQALEAMAIEGLDRFEQVFGYASTYLTPPVYQINQQLFAPLKNKGVTHMDLGLRRIEHQGNGVYKSSWNYTGKKTPEGLTIMVRNVVFEPTDDRGYDPVVLAMNQIDAAFRMGKPAIISSHRVNFCGLMDPENRRQGLAALARLLQQIVQRWPEVEFLSGAELTALVP